MKLLSASTPPTRRIRGLTSARVLLGGMIRKIMCALRVRLGRTSRASGAKPARHATVWIRPVFSLPRLQVSVQPQKINANANTGSSIRSEREISGARARRESFGLRVCGNVRHVLTLTTPRTRLACMTAMRAQIICIEGMPRRVCGIRAMFARIRVHFTKILMDQLTMPTT